jgi:hypothetical protein
MNALWAEETGDLAIPSLFSFMVRWTGRSGMLKLSRRLDMDFRLLRYDRRYGRSFPHDGPFTMGRRSAISSASGRSPGRTRRAQLRRQHRPRRAEQHPDLVAGVAVYETHCRGNPGGRARPQGSIASLPGANWGGSRALHAPHDRQPAVGELPETTRQTRRAEGVAMVEAAPPPNH